MEQLILNVKIKKKRKSHIYTQNQVLPSTNPRTISAEHLASHTVKFHGYQQF